MKTHKMLGVSLTALLIAAAGNLPAQTVKSPTSESTFGRFRSAADDFIRTDSYTAVKQEKWFGFASWKDSSAVLGYAQKFGDLYVAINYNGTAWGNLWNNSGSERDSNAFGSYKPWKEYNTLEFPQTTGANPTTITPNNNIGILIGAADMGFRLFFTSTLQSFKDSDFTVITTSSAAGSAAAGTYKSFEKGYGDITPQLEWAMTKGLIAAGIQPKVTLQLQFHRDYEKMETYNALPANTTQGEQVRLSANYLQPQLQAGLGGFTLYNENGFKASVDLDYTLNLRLFDNEFSYLNNNNRYVTEKIKGLYSTAAGTNYTENTWMKNTITPSLSAQWSSEDKRISLKSKLNLYFNLENSAATTMSFDASDNYKFKKHGNDTTTSSFLFNPQFDVAAQYQIIPKRLTLNAGGSIGVTPVGVKTEEVKRYTYGTENPNTASKTTSPTFGAGTSTSLKAGAVWNMTDNVWLEGATGISGGDSVQLLNNLINFSSVLVGLKF